MKLAVGILISGSGSNMVELVKSMDDKHPAFASVVISNNSDAPGIKKARGLGVPTEIIDSSFVKKNGLDFETELMKTLKDYDVKIICLAGFMKVLSKKFINNFKDRILNIHPSLLPKYKGLNTHSRALQSDDTVAGCTVHLVTPKLDEGPVLAQTEVAIQQNETIKSLASKVLIEEHKLYPKVLLNFSNQIIESTGVDN